MKVLVLNAGSSTLKFLLMDMTTKETIAKGAVERINVDGPFMVYKVGNNKLTVEKNMKNHKDALDLVLQTLLSEKHGVIKDLREITAFGHRFVHGGTKIFDSTLITPEVLKELEAGTDLAPLHIPASITGIKACLEVAPNISNVAVFDTGFHSKMPEYAFRYAIPKKDYEELGIRKYGFHGTSHYFITHEYAKLVNKDVKDLKIITCHLGNGSSISAVKGGHSVDTSMGFTPLEGLVMGTRSGDIDAAVVEFLAKKKNLSVSEVVTYLNKQSGLLGLSNGFSADMRDIEDNLDNPDCQLALDILSYRLKKYIGSYFAVLGGAHAILFAGGIGENDNLVRSAALKDLEALGIELDEELNNQNIRGVARKISKDSSKVDVYIIPTNEELVIAEETLKVVLK
jgi:acetate kinase